MNNWNEYDNARSFEVIMLSEIRGSKKIKGNGSQRGMMRETAPQSEAKAE